MDVDSDFLSTYRQHVEAAVAPAEKAIKRLLRSWKKPRAWHGDGVPGAAIPQPIQRTKVRVKRPESVADKVTRLGASEFPDGLGLGSLERMRDLLGARIITYVPSHIRLVDRKIRSSPDLALDGSLPRAYANQTALDRIGLRAELFDQKGKKPSGYSSFHYFVRVRLPDGGWSSVFEIQVRTMVEEVWGEIEHQLGYKSGRQTEFSVSRQFQVLSSHLAAIDEHFDFLYDRLEYLQTQTAPLDEDLINAENLPMLCNAYQLPISQGEIGSLLEIMETYGIVTVRDLRGRVTQAAVDQIRTLTLQANPADTFTAFNALSVLAMAPQPRSPASIEAQVRANLAFTAYTRQLRGLE